MPANFVKRGVWVVSAILLLGVVAIAVLPYVASTRIVGSRISWELGTLTGYRVEIGAAPAIRVWPSFQATLTDVAFIDRNDIEAGPVLRTDRMEISLSAWAALGGKIAFSSLHLERPTLRLDSQGERPLPAALPENGTIGRAIAAARQAIEEAPDKPPPLSDTALGRIDFSGGRIVAGPADAREVIAEGLEGELAWPALNKAASLSATGTWQGQKTSIDLKAAAPLVLLAGGEARLEFAVKAAPATLSFAGKTRFVQDGYLNGRLSFSTPSLENMLEWVGADARGGPAIGATSLAGDVFISPRRMKFSNAEVGFNGNPGMGVLDIDLAKPVALVSGTLAFESLDLSTLLSAFAPLAESGQEESLTLARLADFDLRLSAAQAKAGATALTDTAASIQIRNGLAAFDISDAVAFGGHIQASLRIDRKPEAPTIEMRLLASDVEGGAFAAAAGLTQLAPIGRGTVSLILKGNGESLQAVAAKADGSLSVNFGPGSLSKFNLDEFLKLMNTGSFFSLDQVAKGTLPITGLDIKATISDGVAQLEKAEASTQKYRLTLSGIVPYVGRGLALSGAILPLQPDGPGGADSEAARFFVGGSWGTAFILPEESVR